ncbi:MAG: SulP family inorganic anion transporter [Pseudanabaenaceae cyanobacterium]
MGMFNVIHPYNLRNDIFGGITTAIVSLPIALAFGVASGAGPLVGLYGAICVGFFAALFGGTPTLISEPTGPMTVVFTTILSSLIASNPSNGLAMGFTVVMVAGLFQIICGYFKLGKYITNMPYSVISGFMSGIGVILIILQIAPFIGQTAPKGGVVGTLMNLPELLGKINPIALILAVLSVVVIYAVPSRFKRFMPPQLLALLVGTGVYLVFFPGQVATIPDIPMGLPTLQIPTFTPGKLTTVLIDGIVLGMLGCIDTLLTSVIADSLTRTEHNSDKELIGQGIANLISGICGGLPGAGATMGTVVNIQAGAKTAISGIVRALVLLTIVLFTAPYVKFIPMPVLAGIALKVGIDILDWSFLKRAHIVSKKGALIMYGVMLLTVFVDLIVAVGVGVFIANILTIEHLSQLHSENIKTVTDTDDSDESVPMTPEEKRLLDQANGRVVLFYLSGPMIFGVAKAIAREHRAIQDAEVLIVDIQDVPKLGVTASLALENVILDACDKGATVYVVGADPKVKERLQKLGVDKVIDEKNWLSDRPTALRLAVEQVRSEAKATMPVSI